MNTEIVDYYSSQSKFTDPNEYIQLFKDLPKSVNELVKIVQGIVIDKDLIELYGETFSDEQKNDTESRYVKKILQIITSRNDSRLTVKRTSKERFVGSCRDYAIVLCSMLRHIGMPSRVRCGFDHYFDIKSDFFDDHWVCEYWNAHENRWILVDANVDNVVKQKYNITVNILDVPRDRFIAAGKAWQMCRSGETDPKNFGVSGIDISGLWFIRGSILKDLAAINKFEALPWEYWGLSDKEPQDMPEEDLKLLDKVADIIAEDVDLGKAKAAYQNPLLNPSKEIKSYTPFGGLKIVEVEE